VIKFWLIYRKEDAVRNKAYIEMYQSYAPEYGMECELVYVEDLKYGIRSGKPYLAKKRCRYNEVKNLIDVTDAGQEDVVSEMPDFAIVRAILPSLNKQLELLGVPCLNNYMVSRICNDKAECYRYLSGKGIPMPDTLFVANKEIAGFLESCPIGTVLKAVDGHGGSQVCLYDGNAEEILHIMGRSDMVAQEKIGNKNSDLRVYVIGGKVLASVLRESNEGFRANFSLGGSVSLYSLEKSEQKLVQKIIELFDFDMVGIDFILDDNGNLVFNEIEDVVGARMLYQCSDIDIVKEYLSYISKKIKGITTHEN